MQDFFFVVLLLMLQRANVKFYVPLALSLAILLGYAGTSLYGPGLSADSITYWSAAQSFRESFTLVKVDGSPYTNWPPLYPVLLSIFPSDYFMQAARWINILGFAYCCLITTLIVSQQAAKKTPYYLFAMCLGFPMLKLACMVWSETIFLALFLSALYCYQNYLLIAKTPWVIACLILFGLSCLQRYTGLFLGAGCVAVLLFTKPSKLKFGIAFLAFSPLALWLIRNRMLSDTSADIGIQTQFDIYNLYHNVQSCLLLLPFSQTCTNILSAFISIGIICALLFTCFVLFNTPKKNLRFTVLAGILLYSVIVLWFAPLSPPELFRYFCVLYPLMLILLSDDIIRTKRSTTHLEVIVLSSLILLQLPIIGTQLHKWLATGAGGYHQTEWLNPEVSAFIRQLPATETIAGNAPDYIYFLTQRRTLFLNPQAPTPVQTVLWFPNIARNQEYWDFIQREGFTVTQSLNDCLVLKKLNTKLNSKE